VVADVTYYYRWGPREAASLTWTELAWWLEQARRISASDRVKELEAAQGISR
jgi:hypothetical protein